MEVETIWPQLMYSITSIAWLVVPARDGIGRSDPARK